MSKYTTQVRFLVETFANDSSLPIGQQIDKALPHIFKFDYPIWSEDYRRILERKIIMKYFNKELALETFELWTFYMEQRLNEIMPYYNEVYLTTNRKYDWLIDVDTTEKYNSDKKYDENTNVSRETNTKNDVSSTVENDATININRTALNSDLPQSTLNGGDYGTNSNQLESTDNTHTTDNVKGNSTNKEDTTDDTTKTHIANDLYTRTMNGLNGSRSKAQLNQEYRNSLINLDKLIIDELYDLFMLIY